MRLSNCPDCDGQPLGTVDTVQAIAQVMEVTSGVYDWAGESKVDWNSQSVTLDAAGRSILACSYCGRHYPNACEEPRRNVWRDIDESLRYCWACLVLALDGFARWATRQADWIAAYLPDDEQPIYRYEEPEPEEIVSKERQLFLKKQPGADRFKSKLAKDIGKAIGTQDRESILAFRETIEGIAERQANEARAFNAARNELVDQLATSQKANRGAISIMIRAAGDPDELIGFDQVVEYCRNHPELSVVFQAGNGDIESRVFEALKGINRAVPTVHSDAVWEEAFAMLEPWNRARKPPIETLAAFQGEF